MQLFSIFYIPSLTVESTMIMSHVQSSKRWFVKKAIKIMTVDSDMTVGPIIKNIRDLDRENGLFSNVQQSRNE